MPDVETARAEIVALFNTGWSGDVTSSSIPILYWDSKGQTPKGQDADGNPVPYVRLTIQHNGSSDESLANDVGSTKFRNFGIITVQVFTALGLGLLLSDRLVKIIKESFRKKKTTSGVWFRNFASSEIGPDGAYFQVNVTGEFIYDEFQS